MLRLLRLSLVSFTIAMLVLVAFGGGFALGRTSPVPLRIPGGPSLASASPANVSDDFRILWESWAVIQRDWVDRKSLDSQKVAQGALKGMLESLGDTHTVYVDPAALRREREDSSGQYAGIGATVNTAEKRLIILEPMDGSPAQSAGLRRGDWIQAVNGEDISSLTLEEAVAKIKGPRGTKVMLTVQREGESRPVQIEVTRDIIRTPSLASRITEDGIAYIRIAQVTQRTAQELNDAIPNLKKANPKGIILDLRSNPGGILDTTVEVTSQFLKDGLVLQVRNADGRNENKNVKSGGQLNDFSLPMVVLVNNQSASASEVISGALQDTGRAKVIGETTFGKGTVNILRELSDGGALYVSIARWYTPNGRQIEGKGITPDIEVKLTPEDIRAQNDTQLKRATEYILTGR